VSDSGLPSAQPSEGPEFVQLLTPEGERVEHPDYRIDASDEEVRDLYRDLVMVRRIDTEATALQRQGELGLWANLLGQEAAQVGAGRALTDSDFAFPTYREHGVAYCKGVDPVTLLGLFRGTSQGGWDPQEHGFGLYTIVIGSQTLHATGYAMGMQRDGGDGATVAFFGDGASSQGDVNEAFVWASVFNAPVVFFCQNNQWAISEGRSRDPRLPTGVRNPVRWLRLPGLRPDREPGRAHALPLGRQCHAADHDSDSVWRWDRCGRTPQRVAGDLLRAHAGSEGRHLLQPRGRVLDDPFGDRE
jgi:pyruvate dehydrogenase E1 component alpha subunit